MIKILDWRKKEYKYKLLELLIKRKKYLNVNLDIVDKILKEIRKKGDNALIKYEKKFNNNSEIILKKKKHIKKYKIFKSKGKKSDRFCI